MARKLNKINRRKKGTVVERYQQMTPDEMKQRWDSMRPRYLAWLGLFFSGAAVLWLTNHVQHFSQGIVNVINVAFQISCIFVVLFGMLTAMSLIYGRATKAKEV